MSNDVLLSMILDGGILFLFLFSAIMGYKKGIISCVAPLLSTILSVLLLKSTTPVVESFISEKIQNTESGEVFLSIISERLTMILEQGAQPILSGNGIVAKIGTSVLDYSSLQLTSRAGSLLIATITYCLLCLALKFVFHALGEISSRGFIGIINAVSGMIFSILELLVLLWFLLMLLFFLSILYGGIYQRTYINLLSYSSTLRIVNNYNIIGILLSK